jgi:tetratricopeptide (TPR) repeat protein
MGSNFWIGNHRGADGGYTPMRAGRGDAAHEREDAQRIAEDALARPLGPAEVSRYWMARSFEEIASAPAAWARLLAWKWFLTWNAVELVDEEAVHTHALDSPLLAVLGRIAHFGVLLPLAVAGVWCTRRGWRRLWFLHATALTFAASVTLFYVFARYRYRSLLSRCSSRARGSRDSHGAPRATLARELAIARRARRGRGVRIELRRSRSATTTTRSRTTTQARRSWTKAAFARRSSCSNARAGADPAFPETYNNLGRAWLAMGDVAAARRELERGLALAPEHAILHLNLAVAVLREGDEARTRVLLERAIALDPLLAAAYGPARRARAARGRRRGGARAPAPRGRARAGVGGGARGPGARLARERPRRHGGRRGCAPRCVSTRRSRRSATGSRGSRRPPRTRRCATRAPPSISRTSCVAVPVPNGPSCSRRSRRRRRRTVRSTRRPRPRRARSSARTRRATVRSRRSSNGSAASISPARRCGSRSARRRPLSALGARSRGRSAVAGCRCRAGRRPAARARDLRARNRRPKEPPRRRVRRGERAERGELAALAARAPRARRALRIASRRSAHVASTKARRLMAS